MRSEKCKCGGEKERLSSSYCNKCQREYTRADYAKNKGKYIAKAKKNDLRYKQEMYRWLVAYFKEHPCVDCGNTDPIVLDFDHRAGVDKVAPVSVLMSAHRFKDAKEEIKKCDVRCSHCHRHKTAREGNWYWLEVLGLTNVPVA